MTSPLLDVHDLSVRITRDEGVVRPLNALASASTPAKLIHSIPEDRLIFVSTDKARAFLKISITKTKACIRPLKTPEKTCSVGVI